MQSKWRRWAAAGVLGALLTGGTSFAATVATPVTAGTTVTQSTYASGTTPPIQTSPAATPGHAGPMVRVLARDANQTVAQVQQLMAQDKNWHTVVAALHLNPATVFHQLGTMRRARLRQMVVVRVLAKLSHKTPAQVRAMRTKGEKWSQVAQALGQNWTQVQQQVGARWHAAAMGRRRQAVIVGTLAKLSHKTPAQVRAMRTKGEKWSQVAQALGQNWTQVQRQVGARLHAVEMGRARNQAVVSLLARLSGKKPAQIAAMKTKGQTWVDVAHSLGIQ